MRKPSLREKGFTLIEVMISTGLLTILVGSMMALLADYSQMFEEAQEKSSIMTLRRRIIQNLNRRESWIVTYRYLDVNSSFQCFLKPTYAASDCPTGRNAFTLYGGREYPPTPQAIVFSTKAPPAYATQDPTYGLTARGQYCDNFDKDSNSGPAKRCGFRLDLTWELLTFGIPNKDPPGQYYPTGYMPSGYYIGSGSEAYFKSGPGYFPGGTGINSYYWWTGTLAAQVRVRGIFTVNKNLKSRINTKSYDFSIIKEVP